MPPTHLLTPEPTDSALRTGLYAFLAGLFLTPIPPDGQEFVRQLVDRLQQLPEPERSDPLGEGTDLLRGFAASADVNDLGRLQLRLAVERTRLFRGVDRERGPAPPYESVYRPTAETNGRLVDVVAAYREALDDLSLPEGERADYLGVELQFMAELCARETAAPEGERPAIWQREYRFLKEHLLAWVPQYCTQMLNAAESDFFRGIALLLPSFLVLEAERLAGE